MPNCTINAARVLQQLLQLLQLQLLQQLHGKNEVRNTKIAHQMETYMQ